MTPKGADGNVDDDDEADEKDEDDVEADEDDVEGSGVIERNLVGGLDLLLLPLRDRV